MISDKIKPPLPGWEPTVVAAADTGTHARTLIKALEKVGADVMYWGGVRFNKTVDRERAIRARIERRNPSPNPRRGPPAKL